MLVQVHLRRGLQELSLVPLYKLRRRRPLVLVTLHGVSATIGIVHSACVFVRLGAVHTMLDAQVGRQDFEGAEAKVPAPVIQCTAKRLYTRQPVPCVVTTARCLVITVTAHPEFRHISFAGSGVPSQAVRCRKRLVALFARRDKGRTRFWWSGAPKSKVCT